VLAGVARLLAPTATGTVLLSVVPRDGMPAIPAPAELAAAYARRGLRLVESRPATPAEVAASGSSWAKRLRAGQARPVTLLRLRAAGAQSAPNSAAIDATSSGASGGAVTRRTA
jgi:16S rRNA (adenine(1408)-N(1))-methyltransferase